MAASAFDLIWLCCFEGDCAPVNRRVQPIGEQLKKLRRPLVWT